MRSTTTVAVPHRPQGAGSLRERRPGVWEVRVATGVDPATRRTLQRSVTVHGTRQDAERRARELTAGRAARQTPPGPLLSLGELLGLWITADHPWKPSTLVGYRSTARALAGDELAGRRIGSLTPADVRAAMRRWAAEGAGPAVVAGRFRALRAALGWAYDERVIDAHPLRQMRGPGRSTPRRPLADHDVSALLLTASTRLLEAEANDNGTPATSRRRHRAELDLLLLRLAADTGARRGELAALRLDDLQGRVLRIERAVSAETLTTPKSGHGRVLTVGAGTAALWEHLTARWQRELAEPIGPWLFSPDLSHHLRLGATSPRAPLHPAAHRRRRA